MTATNKMGKLIAIATALLALCGWCLAGRIGGNAEIEYESINAGGVGYASAGHIMLGGSLGQNGINRMGSNGVVQAQQGFWKADCPCEFYAPTITRLGLAAGQMGITFNTLTSNRYIVSYITQEEGGLVAGTHAITNRAVLPFYAASGMGATTVWANASTATNQARFYLIRCE